MWETIETKFKDNDSKTHNAPHVNLQASHERYPTIPATTVAGLRGSRVLVVGRRSHEGDAATVKGFEGDLKRNIGM